jgi:hypothetical protein
MHAVLSGAANVEDDEPAGWGVAAGATGTARSATASAEPARTYLKRDTVIPFLWGGFVGPVQNGGRARGAPDRAPV